MLEAYLRDNDRAYVLDADGYRRFARGPDDAPCSAQERLLHWYTQPTVDDEA